MSRKTCLILSVLLISALLPHMVAGAGDEFFNLPPLPPPEGYGTLLINRTSRAKGMSPVVFSHWQHRMQFTCRVCHGELEFSMDAGTTEITEFGNRKGRFCGACHNGKVAFRANGNCARCHSGNGRAITEKYNEISATIRLPRTDYGNCINWQEALNQGIIKPRTYLKNRSEDMPFDKLLLLEADWSMIPPSVFPHKSHTAWLDCSNCHPDIFNIKKKTTAHFSMAYILRGQFCGACHLTVAFPMNDCVRCHPRKEVPS